MRLNLLGAVALALVANLIPGSNRFLDYPVARGDEDAAPAGEANGAAETVVTAVTQPGVPPATSA